MVFLRVCQIDLHLSIVGKVDQLTHSEHGHLDVDSVDFLDDFLHVVEDLLLFLLLVARLVSLHDEEPGQNFALQVAIAVHDIEVRGPFVESVFHRVDRHQEGAQKNLARPRVGARCLLEHLDTHVLCEGSVLIEQHLVWLLDVARAAKRWESAFHRCQFDL